METIIFDRTNELRKNLKELERKLNVKISATGRKVTISGDALDEYEAMIILDAMSRGFSASKALMLKEEGMSFRVLSIKDFTRKKNLKEVRARIIGRQGRTRKTMEDISGAEIVVHDNDVGIIAHSENMDEIVKSITALVRGTKQANTYRHLERINKMKKKRLSNL